MIRTVTAMVASVGLAGTVLAATSGEFDNNCALGYALKADVATDCSINQEIGGKVYCFGNEEAKTTFMKDPSGNLKKAEAYAASKAAK